MYNRKENKEIYTINVYNEDYIFERIYLKDYILKET